MLTGMLWYDNTPKVDLRHKVQQAVDYYQHKYHRLPTLCLVHPGMLGPGTADLGGLTIRAYGSLLPGHFWIGIEDEKP